MGVCADRHISTCSRSPREQKKGDVGERIKLEILCSPSVRAQPFRSQSWFGYMDLTSVMEFECWIASRQMLPGPCHASRYELNRFLVLLIQI